jgi:uncharacterized RmlC-like cupin family protein
VRNVESVRPRLRTAAMAMVACADPDDQESVILLPELVASP